MDRREFFRNGLLEISKTTIDAIDAHLENSAARWARPPFALAEFDFLLTCTRCDKCIEVCPTGVIFRLPLHCGVQVAGTPALDLQNRACHLCEGWPCVEVCEPAALQPPAPGEGINKPLPKLAKAQVNTRTCLPYIGPECGACTSCCPVPEALTWEQGKPTISPDLCCGCAICRENCIAEPAAIDITMPVNNVSGK